MLLENNKFLPASYTKNFLQKIIDNASCQKKYFKFEGYKYAVFAGKYNVNNSVLRSGYNSLIQII